MILMISRTDALQEYLLPQTDGLDYKILLESKRYRLADDVSLLLEITGGQWFIRESKEYTLKDCEKGFERLPIKDGDVLNFRTSHGEIFNGIAIDTEIRFQIYGKYQILGQPMITIGADTKCDISYKFMKYVSHSHGRIICEGNRWVIEDISSNGIFVNNSRIKNRHMLNFGDEINIFGLRIVFLGDVIAVGTHYGTVSVHNISTFDVHGFSDNKEISRPEANVVFHRSPRNLPVIYNDTIKIEQPPEPKFAKRRPLIMQIGPAFTMAIPMLLGCSLAIYSSKMRGISSGAFMYTGLITAIGSAVFGSVWAIMNMRNDRKEESKTEDQRINAYGNYLIDISEKLREKYAHNREAMLKTYPSAAECCTYNAENPALWNRNRSHSDFLFCRLGLGSVPFQVKVEIPEEKFSLNSDFLRDKPKLLYNDYQRVENVPVGIDFKDDRLYGIVGGNDKQGAISIMYNIVAGIAANNCYTDVKMIFVYDGNNIVEREQWEFMKWFPHVWSENKKTRFVASNRNEYRDIFYELANVIRQRAENGGAPEKQGVCKPQYVMFVSDASLLENQLLAKYVYNPKLEYGLTTFILTDKYENLPNECEIIIENNDDFHGIIRTMDSSDDRTEIVFDNITAQQLTEFAKNISDLQVQEFEGDVEIPNSLDFFDMYGVNSIEDFHVVEQWYKNRTYNSIKALIGRKAGGADCYLDLHEKYHGPHGLIAGTTGSGKSETLQTYILSLAMNFSPEDVGFFIIDFKGGGMANLFTDLPHMVGQISNLSGNQVRRAMISIKSENRRRQRIFSEYGVNNINLYTRLYKSKEAKIPIPHLIIIIDEFAELKREEPDFMRELISVAQVGRSLGVHLILATQKPNGTVDDNIRSNSKFKLCLRVQDRQDSIDMLHKPDAAYITQAGRCYLQVGNDEIYELFQSGWSGAIYDKNMSDNSLNPATMLTLTGKTALVGSRTKIKRKENERIQWYDAIIKVFTYIYNQSDYEMELSQLGQNEINELANSVTVVLAQQYDYGTGEADIRAVENFISLIAEHGFRNGADVVGYSHYTENRGIKLPELKEKTQLEVLVKYLKKLADDTGFVNNIKLWLPVLSDKILYSELTGEQSLRFDGEKWAQLKDEQFTLGTVIGMYDDPENQLQVPVKIDFAANGHLALCGTVVSGKSTFMQTLIYGLAGNYTPEEVNFYILDFSSHMLSCYEQLPHTGGIVYENDRDKTAKFFTMMERIMAQRQKAFGGGNYSQYVRAYGRKYPAIVVIIDNFANFREKTENVYDGMIMKLAREGVSCGVYLAVTSAGFGINEIPSRIADNIRNVVCLEMGDKYKYLEVLRVAHLNVMPETDIKGRGLVRIDDRIMEFQTALSVDAADDYNRSASLEEWSRSLRKAWNGKCAMQIPCIPEKPVLSDLMTVSGFVDAMQSRNLIPLGYNASDASLECVDLSQTFCFLVSGRARTGKTNAIKIIMNGAKAKEGKIFVIEKGKNELKKLAESVDAYYIESDEQLYRFLLEIKTPFVDRNKKKHTMLEKGMDEKEIYSKMSQEQPYFIFIASLEEFLQMVYNPSEEIGKMNGFVENIIEKGALHNIFFIAGMNPDNYSDMIIRNAYKYFTAAKTGIHLGGNLDKQKVFSISNIPYTEQAKSSPKGVAVKPSVEDESVVYKVVVPLYGGEGN